MPAWNERPSVIVGPTGDTGPVGLSAYEVAVSQGYAGTINEWILSLQGKSAYELAVEQGFVGTINEWILSLQGEVLGTVTEVFGETGTVNQVDYVRFRTTAVTPPVVGALKWNDVDGTLDLPLKGGNVTLQVGQEQVLRARNVSGVLIPDSTVVYIAGASSARPTVNKALADSNATSMGTIGICTEDIANNAEGFVTISGLVNALDTTAFTEGAELWLSSTIAGTFTTTRPVAPNHSIRIGWCVRSHASLGSIFVDVDTGAELQELHDIRITGVAAGQVLQWNAVAGYWENVTSITTAASGNLTSTNLNAALAELQSDIDTRQLNSEKNAINGYAGLDATGKVAAAQLPSYVDDVVEAANFAALPVSGETGKIYTTLDTGKIYRWSGSAYVEISASPGSTDSVTEGVTNLYFTEGRVRATVLTGLSTASSAVITAADSVLGAFGKLQAQLSGYLDAVVTFTNKTFNLTSNTLIGTKAQFDTACSDGDFAYLGQANTFTVAQVVSVTDNTNAALKIIQAGTGNAFVVEDVASDTTPFVIDQNGNIVVGGTTPYSVDGSVPHVQITGVTFDSSLLSLGNTEAGTSYSWLAFSKSRAGGIVNIGDLMGGLFWYGHDGTTFKKAASIAATIDGTPGLNDMPGRLVFSTTADGASTPTERMRIDSAGNVGIGGAAPAGFKVAAYGAMLGATSAYNMYAGGTFQSDVIVNAIGFGTFLGTQAASFTLASMTHQRAAQGTIGAGSSVTNQFGFEATSTLIGATNNYGFYGALAASTGRWNFYAAGTAANSFSGDVQIHGAGKLGYGAGAGGVVTQVTDKGTAVTLNKASGQITMNNAALAAGATVQFTLNNSLISGNDTIIVEVIWGGTDPSKYAVKAGCGSGAAMILVKNDTAGSLSEALVLNFAVIKGSIS